MKVAFFHGFESPAISDKTEYLDKAFGEVYAPEMNYYKPGLFNEVLQEVKKRKIDLLTGSSMGGWFAYCISTLTGIPAILFNPAVHSRPVEPSVQIGGARAKHTVVLGKNDDVIDPEKTIEWFKENGVGSFVYKMESNNHRTPVNIFRKYLSVYEQEGPTRHVKLFEEFINELKIPSGKWVEYDLAKVDDEGMQHIWDMYTMTYAKQGMDLSADDWRELRSKYKATALKDVDRDAEPDAFIIYKPTKWGNKIALLGTNNKREAKSDVVKKLIDLVKTSGWFIEASLKMEEILSSSGAPVITDEKMIRDVVGDDKKPEFEEDGYYTRFLSKAGKRIRKRMYGKL